MVRRAASDDLGGMPRRFHHRGLQRHFKLDSIGAIPLIVSIEKISERNRIAFRSRRLRQAKRRERLGSDHPGRDGAMEALCKKRPQRLIFPRLEIARRPVVEQAETRDMIRRLRDRDRRALWIALAYPNAEFEFIIEPAGRAENGPISIQPLTLAMRTNDWHA